MNYDTFQHGKFYRITHYGRINLDFPQSGNLPLTLDGKGEPVWFVGLAWKPAQFLLEEGVIKKARRATRTLFYLIASNYFHLTKTVYVEHDEMSLKKRDRVKTIELFTLKQFPLLIGTKTTTLFDHFLKGEKVNLNKLSL
jgi:hypothetical protein